MHWRIAIKCANTVAARVLCATDSTNGQSNESDFVKQHLCYGHGHGHRHRCRIKSEHALFTVENTITIKPTPVRPVYHLCAACVSFSLTIWLNRDYSNLCMLEMRKISNIFFPPFALIVSRRFHTRLNWNLNVVKLSYVILKLLNAVRYHLAIADRNHAISILLW